MHGWHFDHRETASWLRIGSCVLSLLSGTVASADESPDPVQAGSEIPLSVRTDPDRVTRFECQVTITGTLTTPSSDGVRQWDFESHADLKFAQRQLPTELAGPHSFQAVRRYSLATVNFHVGEDHHTRTALPRSNSLIHIRGSDSGLHAAAAAHPLSRGQFDLLQMPCDPLHCSALLPTRDVQVGEKWNTDYRGLPRLAGLEAVADQSLSCELESLEGELARIQFAGSGDGAVFGSACAVELAGSLTLNTNSRLVTEFRCQLKEKQSVGPVRPGLDAVVDVVWSQAEIDGANIPTDLNERLFDRPLALQTPWRLVFNHSREWHVFNQNDRLVKLRQVRDGDLIAQCYISPGVVMPPGQHTSDVDFRSDVQTAISARSGTVISEVTTRDDGQWRIRHVQASGSVGETEIVWDYYLCTAASGDQFSLMFSHSKGDNDAFGDEPHQILSSLVLPPRRAALPFRN